MDTSSPPVTPHQWEHVKKFDGTPVLYLSIRRPAFPDQSRFLRMERYFSKLEEQWKIRWNTVMFPGACRAFSYAKETDSPFLPWHAQVEYTITLWQPPLISLRLDTTESPHQSKPLRFCMGETWNCASGYPCALQSFLTDSPLRRRKNLLDSLKNQAAQQLASGESLLDPDCTSKVEYLFDANRFYLTTEGLCIFYPLCTIGAHAEGIPVFTIPLK